jgi:hypothetical protein
MVKKSRTRSDAGKKAARTRTVRDASEQATSRVIRWIESDEPLDDLGHGVQFLHDELHRKDVVAFCDGFEWRGGGPATVRLLGLCPTSITADHWSKIIESTHQAVLVFLSNERNLNSAFRHGPIHIIING